MWKYWSRDRWLNNEDLKLEFRTDVNILQGKHMGLSSVPGRLRRSETHTRERQQNLEHLQIQMWKENEQYTSQRVLSYPDYSILGVRTTGVLDCRAKEARRVRTRGGLQRELTIRGSGCNTKLNGENPKETPLKTETRQGSLLSLCSI